MCNMKALDLPLEGAVGHHTSPSEPPASLSPVSEYLQSSQEGEAWEEEPLMSLDGEEGGRNEEHFTDVVCFFQIKRM